LIERLAPTILVPDAVIEEVRVGERKDRTAATAVEWAEKYRVADIAVATSIEHWDLGPGESQVIAYCIGGSRWAVLDDRAARRCAAPHNGVDTSHVEPPAEADEDTSRRGPSGPVRISGPS